MLTFLPVLLSGCAGFDEELPQIDIQGQLVLPRAAATRDIFNPRTGQYETVTDARMIGPVWLGAFPDIEEAGSLYDYSHPEMGPVYIDGVAGNTYPYGGGSVGRFAFACFSQLACKVVSGRFSDYDDVLDYFANVVRDPVVDEFGVEVDSAGYYQTYCYQLFEYTADFELDFINPELHFSENSQGDFVADFDMWNVTHNQDMKIWGWMDAPSEAFTFSTCNEALGEQNNEYANDFTYGTNQTDLLNFPSKYIYGGDYVVSEPFQVTTEDAVSFRDSPPDITLNLDFLVED